MFYFIQLFRIFKNSVLMNGFAGFQVPSFNIDSINGDTQENNSINTDLLMNPDKRKFFKELKKDDKLDETDLNTLEMLEQEIDTLNAGHKMEIEMFIEEELVDGYTIENKKDFQVLLKSLKFLGFQTSGKKYEQLLSPMSMPIAKMNQNTDKVIVGNLVFEKAPAATPAPAAIDIINGLHNSINLNTIMKKNVETSFRDTEKPTKAEILKVLKNDVLRKRKTGDFNYALQVALSQLVPNNSMGNIDGYFGENTRKTVLEFQKLHSDLDNDGKLGPKTVGKIIDVLGGGSGSSVGSAVNATPGTVGIGGR